MNRNYGQLFATLGVTAAAAILCGNAKALPTMDGRVLAGEYQTTKSIQFQLDNGTPVVEPGVLAVSTDAAGNVYVAFSQPLSLNDNTYGTGVHPGWAAAGKSHSFGDLVGSDKGHFDFFNNAGVNVLSFDLDYITASSGAPSGYKSLGVSGGDGSIQIGSASRLLGWGTSLDFDLNAALHLDPTLDLTKNSPVTDALYTPNPKFPDWVYTITYEVQISAAAFGASGFKEVSVPYAHASPNKLGKNTVNCMNCVVPEPTSAMLVGIGIMGLVAGRRKRQ